MVRHTIINFDAFNGPNKYDFLSNFYVHPLRLWGDEWKSGEHAFQAGKATTERDYLRVMKAKTPGMAKAIGRSIELRPDWEVVKYDIMAAVVRSKFTPGTELAQRLLDTGSRLLVEGTRWGDNVWGVVGRSERSRGRNWLGTLLMARRAELQAMEAGAPDFHVEDHNERYGEPWHPHGE